MGRRIASFKALQTCASSTFKETKLKPGIFQDLTIVAIDPRSVYLNDGKDKRERARMARFELTEGDQKGSRISAFVYNGKGGELLATKNHPFIQLGEVKRLMVKEVNRFGAFLDWGLEKDLYLPFKEQTFRPKQGQSYLFTLRIDGRERLYASMKIRDMLKRNPPYKERDWVKGIVYSIHPELGAFLAVDGIYDSMIPKKDLLGAITEGENLDARVQSIDDKGRLLLSLRDRAHLVIGDDAERIYAKLVQSGGYLNLGDHSSPEEIKRLFGISKSSFKRALGKLYRKQRIRLDPKGIYLVEKTEDGRRPNDRRESIGKGKRKRNNN